MDKQLETLVTCAVCLDRFVHPKILPCQHTFCLKPCLQNLVIDKSIRCPHCRTIHKLPKRGLSDFPNNLTIVSILDFSPKPNSDIKICQECLKSNCATLLCQHCEKKLCETCLSVHSQQLIQGLMRSVNQVRRLFSKMSEMITELESRQIKSKTAGESVKTDIIKAIDRCIVQLTNRKKTLLGQVDLYVNAEGRQLKTEQENLEMELVNMSGHCENAEKKCQHFLDGTKRPTDPSFQNEITRLTHQSKEHLRNMKLIRSNVEERMLRCIEFHNDNEHTLHALMSSVGEVTFTSPTQLSFNLGSNAVYNEMEIERTFERSRTQSEEDADIVSNYIPSFTSPTTSPRLNVDSSVGSFISALITPRITNPTPALSINAQETQTFLRNKGRVKRCFSSKGSDISSLNWPRGVAVSPTNQIIVADSSNHRVQIFNEEGSPVLTFGSYGSGEAEFDCLAGIHVTSQGWIIISDRYNHRIQIFDSMGRFIRMFGQEGSGEGDLSYPWGVSTDNMGFVYVCDKDNHRIQVFTLDGQFIRKFGRLGTYDGQFDSPLYLAITSDNKVLVSDNGNHRIQVFDKYGRFMFKIGREGSADGQLKYPRGVAVDAHGNIAVADSGNNRIQIYKPDGSYMTNFGSWGSSAGQLKGIEGICFLPSGDIVVSDRENHRIQIF